jgi:hypothetical protein
MLPHRPLCPDLNPVAVVGAARTTRTRTPDLPQTAPPVAPNPALQRPLLCRLPGGPPTIHGLAWSRPGPCHSTRCAPVYLVYVLESRPNMRCMPHLIRVVFYLRHTGAHGGTEQLRGGSPAKLGVVCRLGRLITHVWYTVSHSSIHSSLPVLLFNYNWQWRSVFLLPILHVLQFLLIITLSCCATSCYLLI